MDYVQRLPMANLQLELGRNAEQVNIVAAQAVAFAPKATA